MKYIQAIEEYERQEDDKVVFLAGGISNCPDWQKDAVEHLQYTNLVVINPRRKFYDSSDEEARIQIEWEHKYLVMADIILFWFPKETLCPITLFEYGKYLVSKKPLVVGVHPDYKRRLDIQVQTRLEKT